MTPALAYPLPIAWGPPQGLRGITPQQGAAAGTAAAVGLAPVITHAIFGALAPSFAIPLVGAGIAALGFAIQAILDSGCGQTCIVTSNWANDAADKLHQNIAAYFGIPALRPKSVQMAALGNFDAVWNYLYQECSSPALGNAGVNCIQDRKQGACKWRATAPEFPGEPAAGSCWNWFAAYRDPIANDPQVYDDTTVQSQLSSGIGTVGAAFSGLTGLNPVWLLVGALLIGAAVVL